jgi:hypothetical protein
MSCSGVLDVRDLESDSDDSQTVKAPINSVQFIFLIAPIRLSNTARHELREGWGRRLRDGLDGFRIFCYRSDKKRTKRGQEEGSRRNSRRFTLI